MEGRGSDTAVTRPFSVPYKQKMIERMTGMGPTRLRLRLAPASWPGKPASQMVVP
jgi:hypothetical protein